MKLADQEKRALGFAVLSNLAVLAVFFVLVLVPGMPLDGPGQPDVSDDSLLSGLCPCVALFLIVWYLVGVDLGPVSPLDYLPN